MKIRKPSVRQNAKKQRQEKLHKILRREMEEEGGSLPIKPLPLMAPILVLTQKLFPFSIFDASEANGNRLSGDILRRKPARILSDTPRSLIGPFTKVNRPR